MKLELIQIKDSLSKAFQKQSLKRKNIELLKTELTKLYNYVDDRQDEDYHKNLIADFLKAVYYRDRYIVNVNRKQDLVIKLGNNIQDKVGVILEFKKPSEAKDMITFEKPNSKAFQQLILYYLRERIDNNNTSIKHLIATNFFEWYIFDEVWFEKNIFRNTNFVKDYEEYKLSGHDTKFFYEQIAYKQIEQIENNLPCTFFNLKDYQIIISNSDKSDDVKLINLYKILSPENLLKLPFANDSNSLNKEFYDELLYILGLEEIKNGSKRTIERAVKNKNEGSLVENTIQIISSRKKLKNVINIENFGTTEEEQLYSIALELCITWLNRILFLKLLEGQLVKYHKGNKNYKFLNNQKIKDYDELDELFFDVIAIPTKSRIKSVNDKFGNLPYLNSSLFEITELEDETVRIADLKDRFEIPIYTATVLKDQNENRKTGFKSVLHYLFEFLNSFNFASDDTAEIQEENKSIISASVLGLIFEKLNGYRDGSFFTPGFITMYICRETLQRAIVTKFKEIYKTEIKDFEELKEFIDYSKTNEREKANEIVNSVKICDPAVGSGHFLVSALNELIAIKSELRILNLTDKTRVKGYEITVENDELIITNEETGEQFSYHVSDKHAEIKELQQLQETLFNEKRTIIENCLFGVDINPKSVMICRLRLWIELLKNAYYTKESNYLELETLPNIDINIKTGNSLISKFDNGLNIFERAAVQDLIKKYKLAVDNYKNCSDYSSKDNIKKQISRLKIDLEKFAIPQDKSYKEYLTKQKEFELLKGANWTNGQVKDKMISLSAELAELEKVYLQNYKKVYNNSFEWAIEFPEILSDDGNFVGFDVVIGNPPYLYRNSDIVSFKETFKARYFNSSGNYDLYKFFIERAIQITKPNYYNSFITNSSFLIQKSYLKTREFLLKNTFIDLLMPLGPNVFDEATVDTAIYIIKKGKNGNHLTNVYLPEKPIELDRSTNYNVKQQRFKENQDYVFDLNLDNISYIFAQRLFNSFPNIEKGFEFGVGINTGYIKSELTAKAKIDDRYHPMVKGSGISRYGNVETEEFIMYDKEFVKSKGDRGRTLPDEKFFTEPKILIVRTRNLTLKQRIVATIDTERKYNLNRLSNIIAREGSNIYGLLGILNSKLYNWLYSTRFIDYEIKPIYLRNSPLADTNNKQLIKLVKSVIKDKQNDMDTTEIEKQIDELVFQLYYLTNDEIEIVNKNN